MKNKNEAVIPAKVRYSEKLVAIQKLFYGEITALSKENGYCTAEDKYFAGLYGVYTYTIITWLNTLLEEGFIDIELYSIGEKKAERRIIPICE